MEEKSGKNGEKSGPKMQEFKDFWGITDEEIEEIEAENDPDDDSDDGFNEELSGLIEDDDLGIRWKHGVFGGGVRGQKRVKEDDGYTFSAKGFTITAQRVSVFIERYMMLYDYVSEIAIKNTVMMSSIADGEICYYDTVLSQVTDVDCKNVTRSQFEYFYYRMKLSFLKNSSVILNSLATVQMYSKFTGVKEGTIRKWMARGKVESVEVCGVRFIFVDEDELVLWNAFLMEEFMRKDIDNVDQDQRAEVADLYYKLYGKRPIDFTDSVALWFESENMTPNDLTDEENDVFCVKGKYETEQGYGLYCFYCSEQGIEPISIKKFSMRITKMGFGRYNSNKRGFYYWKMVL